MKNFTFTLFAITALITISVGAMAQGGSTPLAGSTHTYTVTPESTSNTITWSVVEAGGYIINSQSVATTTSVANITWTTAGSYTLRVTETNTTTGCTTVKSIPITVTANSFDISTASPTAFCNSADGQVNYSGSTATTSISIPVNMVTGISTFNPNWEFTFLLSPNSGTTISSVAASSGLLSGTGTYTVTGLTSASGVGSVNITMNVSGDIFSVRDVVLEITSAKELSYNTNDVDTNDWVATQMVNAIPQTSTILTD